MDIAQLVQKAKKGDDEAFEQLISSIRDKLYRTAYSYVRNEQDALDIYQETIYTAYISIKELKRLKVFLVGLLKLPFLNQLTLFGKSLAILRPMMRKCLHN